jgi:hypothetical protein
MIYLHDYKEKLMVRIIMYRYQNIEGHATAKINQIKIGQI